MTQSYTQTSGAAPVSYITEIRELTFNIEKKDTFLFLGDGVNPPLELIIVPNDGSSYIFNQNPDTDSFEDLSDEYLEAEYRASEEPSIQMQAWTLQVPADEKNTLEGEISATPIAEFKGDTYDKFKKVTEVVIKQLEGGYYNPDWHATGDARYGSSGETMYGIDRKAGGAINNTPFGKQFWSKIDVNKTRQVWKWNYIPPDPLGSELRKLAVDVIYPCYKANAKNYYKSTELQQIIESDPRLLFHMSYACWNGPGWFKKFSKDLRDALQSGIKDANKLVQVAINSRTKEGLSKGSAPNSLIAQGGNKISKFINTSTITGLA